MKKVISLFIVMTLLAGAIPLTVSASSPLGVGDIIFSPVAVGYTQPDAINIMVTNPTGSGIALFTTPVTIDNTTDFILSVTIMPGVPVPAGGALSIGTIRPAAGLPAGVYSTNITVTDTTSATVTAQATFTVTDSISSNIPYLDENGNTQICASAVPLVNTLTTLTSGWYIVNGTVAFSQRVIISENVHIILTDGSHLDASTGGISVGGGAALTLYAQSTGRAATGSLTATAVTSSYAGIGADNRRDCGVITINGGEITANGAGGGAGIGGCEDEGWSVININDGFITATGGSRSDILGGAGIGSGSQSGKPLRDQETGTINIKGGTIVAKGGYMGAGIGGGTNTSGGILNISGGNVTATGGIGAAGIGGGCADGVIDSYYDEENDDWINVVPSPGGNGGIITISGGSVTATGGNGISLNKFAGAGIGSGGGQFWGFPPDYSSSGDAGKITITANASVTAQGGSRGATGGGGAGIGSGGVGLYAEPGLADDITIATSATVDARGGNRGQTFAGADIGTGGSHNTPGISSTVNTTVISIIGDTAPRMKLLTHPTFLFREFFSVEELSHIAAGELGEIRLSAENIADSLSAKERSLIENKLNNDPKLRDYSPGRYMDISVSSKFGNNEPVKKTKLNNRVLIGIEIPDNLKPVIGQRHFLVLGIHNEDEEPIIYENLAPGLGIYDQVIFETDRFSTFVLLYRDVRPPHNVPQTGVNRNILLPVVFLSLGFLCILGAQIYRRNTKKTK